MCKIKVSEIANTILDLFPKDIFQLIDSYNGDESILHLRPSVYLMLGFDVHGRACLQKEAKEGDIEAVQYILKNTYCSHGKINRAMIQATKNDHRNIVICLLDHHLTKTGLGRALHYACQIHDIDLLRMVLKKGGNIKARKYEVLRVVSAKGDLELLKFVIEKYDADIHHNRDQILRISCLHGHLPVVKYLLEQGADISALDYEAVRSLQVNNHWDVLPTLLDALGPDSTIYENKEFLIRCVQHSYDGNVLLKLFTRLSSERLEIIMRKMMIAVLELENKYLVSKAITLGGKFTIDDDMMKTYCYLMKTQNVSLLDFIITHEPTIVTPDFCQNVFMYGTLNMVRRIIPFCRDEHDLVVWATKSSSKLSLQILKYEEKLSPPQEKIQEALVYSVTKFKKGIVLFLIDEYRADPKYNDSQALRDLTLVRYAYGRKPILDILFNKGVDPNANGGEPLWNAVKAGDVGLFEYLLVHKADIHYNDDYVLKNFVRYYPHIPGNKRMKRCLEKCCVLDDYFWAME